MRRAAAAVFAVTGLLAVSGCGTSGGTISGTVTFKTLPVTQGTVVAWSATGDSYVGEIQPDGTYRIENCPPGKLKISVSSPDPAATAAAPADRARMPANAAPPPAPKGDPAKWVAIPENYSNPETSGLEVEVHGNTEYKIVMQ